MGFVVTRRRALADGRVEIYTPYPNEDGYYVMADRVADAPHNHAINQFYLKDLAAVVARLRRGAVSLRMKGDLTGQKNLISAREIEIEEDAPARSGAVSSEEDDPFAIFEEWASEADDKAYANL
jgi:hypothetical protein